MRLGDLVVATVAAAADAALPAVAAAWLVGVLSWVHGTPSPSGRKKSGPRG